MIKYWFNFQMGVEYNGVRKSEHRRLKGAVQLLLVGPAARV